MRMNKTIIRIFPFAFIVYLLVKKVCKRFHNQIFLLYCTSICNQNHFALPFIICPISKSATCTFSGSVKRIVVHAVWRTIQHFCFISHWRKYLIISHDCCCSSIIWFQTKFHDCIVVEMLLLSISFWRVSTTYSNSFWMVVCACKLIAVRLI